MKDLNLPIYSFNIKSEDNRKLIFDPIRKKYIVLTPEEWVRQNFIQYLINEKNVPEGLIIQEHKVKLNTLNQRSDIVIYSRSGTPILIVECKAPSVKLTQATFEQIARYNIILQVKYLIVTNGLNHYCCMINTEEKSYSFLKDIPKYEDLV